jgi:hypothetical protein
VFESLTRGFKELGINYRVDSNPVGKDIMACVLSGVKTLNWVIGQKRTSKIKKIMAGPNLVVTPFDSNNLMQSPEIDIIILPSQWIKDWWTSLVPVLEKKIQVWPAGVKELGFSTNRLGGVLIYQKNAPASLLNLVLNILKEKGRPVEVIRYGRYRQKEYYAKLAISEFMVYLSESESQGLALQEAWSANLPTLVWNRGFMEYENYTWQSDKISAPYLSSSCGMFFKGQEDFSQKLNEFLQKKPFFQPAVYIKNNLSDKICAQKFVSIAQPK